MFLLFEKSDSYIQMREQMREERDKYYKTGNFVSFFNFLLTPIPLINLGIHYILNNTNSLFPPDGASFFSYDYTPLFVGGLMLINQILMVGGSVFETFNLERKLRGTFSKEQK